MADDELRSFAAKFLSGLSYGLTATLLSHPFDTIKTRQQVLYTGGQEGFAGALRATTQQLGLSGLYLGFLPSLASSVLFRTVPFIGYTWTRDHLARRAPLWSAEHPAAVAMASGAVGGVCRSMFECPAEVWKVRRQLNQQALAHLHHVGEAARFAYTGLAITALRNAAVTSLFWLFYTQSEHVRLATLPPHVSAFVGGALCSTGAWLFVYPLDSLKSHCQSTGAAPTGSTTTGRTIRQAARHILASGAGLRGFYAGLSAGLMRSMLANGGGMAVYEYCSRAFQSQQT